MSRSTRLALTSLWFLTLGIPTVAGQESASDLSRRASSSRGHSLLGVNTAALRQNAVEQKLRMRTARAAAPNVLGIGAAWISLGPRPLPSDASGVGTQDYGWVTGRATAVAIDPNDPAGNTVFVGGANSGVWKSTNAGAMSADPSAVTWSPVTEDQPTLSIGAIAIQPQLSGLDPSHSIVLAGTGETNDSEDAYYGLGILRSTDGGETWSLISQDAAGHKFAGLGFSSIVFSSANPGLVVAAVGLSAESKREGLENPAAMNRGLYYSTDSGATWNKATITDSGVAIDPSSATSVAYNTAAGKFYAAVQSHGLYSTSDGANWIRLALQPGNGITAALCPAQSTNPSACLMSRGEIAVVSGRSGPNNLGEMYAWYVDFNDADQGIWKSLDGGASWTSLVESGIANCGDPEGCGTTDGNYNLALAAVPNGTATDIYAGAVNLYKCTITNAVPNCSGSGNTSFFNLTHAYGCSGIARVHPNQHAIASLVAEGSALLYFANDGGLYRALDGYLGLRNGACGTHNQFDSLNHALGPMTQFISLSQSPTDANVFFGGTEQNGAPATVSSQSSASWLNLNAGTSGFTAIDPQNENQLFVSAPPSQTSGVNLFSCLDGIDCHAQDFEANPVIESSALAGDIGPEHLPFILDPQNPATLILGTCRIWRGAASGGSFQLLSPDFENDGGGPCRGSEVNMVRSLAAGGPVDANANSLVIYAGTDGGGPATPGGRIWITTTAGNGLPGWKDRTGSINPLGFAVSAVALDRSDASGQTAYVTIMGFHTPHVWKTTNAGISWSDFTGNLPDAPADSIVVDSVSSTLYVGTDIGVFASSTQSPSWTEVGPASGLAGFLPDVPITALAIFNFGGLKRLRAATYGTGVWEWNLVTDPDFQLSIANTPLTSFATQTATFNGTISALNGYSNSVNLSCAAGSGSPPQNCSATPASVVPSPSSSNFTVSASGLPGDYAFNVHAVGTDSASVAHDFAVTLHIVDFTLEAPSPTAVSVVPGSSSVPVSLMVSAQGEFSGQVALSCSGLPQGANCLFTPPVASPTSGNPVTVTLTVSAMPGTETGSSQITISALATGEPAKTQALNLSIVAAPDFSLVIANPSQTAHVNTSAVFNGSLTSLNGYKNSINLSCGQGAPPNCALSSTSLVPTDSGAAFTVTVSSGASQAYNFNLVATGTDASAIVHSTPVSFSVLPEQSFDFTMAVNPLSGSTPAGQAASFGLGVAPSSGTFPSPVSFSCSNLPPLANCAFNPAQVPAGAGNSTVQFSISTTSPTPAAMVSVIPFLSLPLASLLWLTPRRIAKRAFAGLGVILVLTGACISCGGGLRGNVIGGGGNPGTPPGTYTIKVTANAVSVAHSTQVTLTVTP
jgi:hypothetical protein